jgi:TP901 family phage tail tape measure protein
MAERLEVIISANPRQLTAGLKTAQARLKNFSSKMSALGSSLQTRLALPLAAAGGSAIKMAADFDKSMTKIKTLVGVAASDVDGMTGSIKQLATQAGVSSGEAAEAMFFITSAGLRGADAMAVLEQSTKASALGLGDVATVADLSTSALNAYGVENLSATKATDVLTAAVREGKLEASELSGAMGRTLPIASNMGVKFEEVGAAFAAMSRTGTNANEAATQLNAIMMAIMKPTTQSAAALKELGYTSEELRQQIKDDGLLSVFQDLKEASVGNAQAFETAFGPIRALRGILDLTGASADTTAQIFQRMSNTSGMTAQAFDELQNSAEFKLRKGLIGLKNSFSELGAVLMSSLMPLLQNVIGFATNLFKSFNKLDPVTQQLSIGFAALAVALPTILSVGGSLVGVFAAMTGPVGLIAAGVAAVAYVIATNWNEVLPVVVGLYNRFVDLYNSSESLRLASALIKTAFQTAFIRIKQQIDQVVNVFKTFWNLIKEFAENGTDGAFGDILEQGFNNAQNITEQAGKDIGEAFTENLVESLKPMEHKTVQQVQTSLSNIATKTKGFMSSLFGQAGIAAGGGGGGRAKVSTVSAFGTGGGGDSEENPLANKVDEAQEAFSQLGQTGQEAGNAIAQGFENLTQGGNFFAPIIKMLKQLVIRLVAAAGAAAVLSVLLPGASVAKLGGVKGIMTSLGGIPQFANGGIISGPTLGLMGEYSGARSNPEVVAPLDKLKGMIGQEGQKVSVGGQFRVQGQDLVLALQRADKNRNRIL